MSTPALPYRVLDQVLNKNRGNHNSKYLMKDCHLVRQNKTIALVYRYHTANPQTMAVVYRNGSINVYNRYHNASHEIWGFRVQKLFDLLNGHTLVNDDYLSRLTCSDGYRNNIAIQSVAELPKREMTADELQTRADYEALEGRERWGKYYSAPSLHYGPNYWYGQIDNTMLNTGIVTAPLFTIRAAPGKTPGGYWIDRSTQRFGDSGLSVLKGHKKKRFYKCMSPEGTTSFSNFTWDMPKTDEATGETIPGNWHTITGELEFCRKGIHICTLDQITAWMSQASNMLVEMEYEGPVLTNNSSDNKYLVRKARVVRIAADLTDFIAQFGTRNHGDAAFKALKGLVKGKQLKKPTVYQLEIRVTHKVTAEITAYSKAEMNRQRAELIRAAKSHNIYQGTTKLVTCSSKATILDAAVTAVTDG